MFTCARQIKDGVDPGLQCDALVKIHTLITALDATRRDSFCKTALENVLFEDKSPIVIDLEYLSNKIVASATKAATNSFRDSQLNTKLYEDNNTLFIKERKDNNDTAEYERLMKMYKTQQQKCITDYERFNEIKKLYGPAEEAEKPFYVFVNNGNQLTRISLSKGESLTVGRKHDRDIQFNDPWISSKLATISCNEYVRLFLLKKEDNSSPVYDDEMGEITLPTHIIKPGVVLYMGTSKGFPDEDPVHKPRSILVDTANKEFYHNRTVKLT